MILYASWTRLPLHVRNDIAKQFGIAKSGPTHVQDNVVVSDGYKIMEVETALNLEAIKEFLGVDSTDLGTLFELLVAKMTGIPVNEPEPTPAPAEPAPEPVGEVPVSPVPKKRRRVAKPKAVKKAKK